MSQVIYARVPDALKTDVEEYAGKQGMSLTTGAVDLIQRGLDSTVHERSMSRAKAKLIQLENENRELDGKLRVALSELSGVRAFTDRASQLRVGTCPNADCGLEISGFDLLGPGQCKHCRQSLLNLIAPPTSTQLDQREVGFLVGALGALLVGLVVLGSK
jgi:hypothetical protein